MDKTHVLELRLGDKVIPVKIYIERRQNTRASLGSKYVNLRIPKGILFKPDVQKHLDWLENWLKELESRKPFILHKYIPSKKYADKDVLVLMGQSYQLDIIIIDREDARVSIKGTTIFLELPNKIGYDTQAVIRHLLIKISQKHFKAELTRRVKMINDRYFGKEINSVRLKYNKSNWGSCSSGKNLNFSVRLLLAPLEVIDYVIVHELSHLIEMNHSKKFWEIVQKIKPDYTVSEDFLRKNNHILDF
ncbi:MAG: YgjP-like metallopeptidase domain-containing protein [Saprospiraceae bacterium]